MSYQIYICDLPADCTDEQLTALLQPHGELTAIEWQPPQEDSNLRRAVVTVDSEAPLLGIVGQLNRQKLNEQPIIASPAEPPDPPVEPTNRQVSASVKIAAQLGEKAGWPRMMIQQTVGACGVRFAMEIMQRAQAIDEAGGMLVPDGSRRRTVGGIFFFLSRQYIMPDMGRYIFHQTKQAVKTKKARKKQAETAPAEAATPTKADAAPPVEPDPPAPEPAADPAPEPAPPAEDLDRAREQLDALREVMRAVNSELEAVKSGRAPKTTGAFSLMKQIVDTQKAIDALLAEHPALKQP